MYTYQQIEKELLKKPCTWLVTGVAGFIGSNILEQLLLLNQKVVGLDNLSTGTAENLDSVANAVGADRWENFDFYNLDITDQSGCEKLFQSHHIDYVIHQAAISSVPFSIRYPEKVAKNNIDGFLNILELSRIYNVKSFVYASSSSVYGDSEEQYKSESQKVKILSPYASSKFENELVASHYIDKYKFNSVGLRYFNVYGCRQDHTGGYAAVIPKWIEAVFSDSDIYINGDGSTTRDFCHVNDVVKANILACFNKSSPIYNIGCGQATSLLSLFNLIIKTCTDLGIKYSKHPEFREFLDGDIRHSCANISLASDKLNYYPSYTLEQGLDDLINSMI